MANDLLDGFTSLSGGMNSLVDPSLLNNTQYSRGVNIVVRDGVPTTRPGFSQIVELAAGEYQGAKVWQLNSGHYLVYVSSGSVRVYDYAAQTETNLGVLMSLTATCYFEQVDRWMVIQDNVSRPVVLQRSDAGVFSVYGRNPPEVCLVVGSTMIYAHGRIHYVPKYVPQISPSVPPYDVLPTDSAEPGGMVFVSSDVRDSLDPEWVFRMSEHRVTNEGGALALPEELGFITAMSALRGSQTGTGVGEVVVFAREGVCAFDLSYPRTQWKDVNLSRMQFRGAGTFSPRSLTTANNDLLYVDTDAWVRRYQYDTLTLNGGDGNLSNLPISTCMGYYATSDDRLYLPAVSGAFAGNRYFWTLHGTTGNLFQGLGVLDAAHLAPLTAQGSTVFDGVWTGFNVLQIFTGRIDGANRLQAIVRAGTNRNILLMHDPTTIVDPRSTSIESILVTRSYEFGDPTKSVIKELRTVKVRLSQVKTPVTLEVLYRVKGYPVWTSMGVRTINMPGGGPQYRRTVKFAVDLDAIGCDPTSQKFVNVGTEFQVALKWSGYCRIENCLLTAALRVDVPEEICSDENTWDAVLPTDEGLDDFSYQVDLT